MNAITSVSPLRALIDKLRDNRRLAAAFGVGVLNQVVSSGMNFLFSLYLVRELVPQEFGLYGISFACVLFYGGLVGAFFLLQMVLYSPDKASDDQDGYAFRVLLMLAGFCVATVLIGVAVQAVAGWLVDRWQDYHSLFWSTLAACMAYALKEYCIRYAYNRRRESLALQVNSIIAGVLFLYMLALATFDADSLVVEQAMWAYAIAHTCGALYMLRRVFPKWHAIRSGQLNAEFGEIRGGGIWASISFIVYFARIQAATIVTTATLGPIGVAALNASRIYVTPAMMLTPTLSQMAVPRMAVAVRNGQMRVTRASMVISSLLLSVALFYGLLLWGAFDSISHWVTASRYGEMGMLVFLWSIYGCVLALRNAAEMGVQVLRRQRLLALMNGCSMVATVVVVFLLSDRLGLGGAIGGLIFGEGALTLGLWWILSKFSAESLREV